MNKLKKLRNKIHTNCRKSKDTTIPTKPYRDGLYKVSKHAVKRMNEREINKGQVHTNLRTTPLYKEKIKIGKNGRHSYQRYSINKINTRINPFTFNVNTVSYYHTKEWKKYLKGFIKKYGKIF